MKHSPVFTPAARCRFILCCTPALQLHLYLRSCSIPSLVIGTCTLPSLPHTLSQVGKWLCDYKDVQLVRTVGQGSYARVSQG